MEKVSDLNNLYKAYLKSKSGSDWKPQIQMYEMNYLSKLVETSEELQNHTYKAKQGSHFIVTKEEKHVILEVILLVIE